jgi:hypothetical protein
LKMRALSGDTRCSLEQIGLDILRPSNTTAERYGKFSSCCRDTGVPGLGIVDSSSAFSLWSILGFARRWKEMVLSAYAVV